MPTRKTEQRCSENPGAQPVRHRGKSTLLSPPVWGLQEGLVGERPWRKAIRQAKARDGHSLTFVWSSLFTGELCLEARVAEQQPQKSRETPDAGASAKPQL